MKTFPDFTWEWIIANCEMFRRWDQDALSRDPSSERHKSYLATIEATLAIIPKLREHPQLKNIVPMKSLMSLRWFPAENREISLYCDGIAYNITVTTIKGLDSEINEEKIVSFDEVANEIYAYISKLRDD
ncbi:MAG: hypothetical protein H0X30_01555 [Anaerolineae bacterium]|nr:hypothetical protein [Anaerolineae bacterium]